LTDLPLVLRDLSIVLAIATAVALVFGRLHLSVVAAFLVAGAILGPTGAGKNTLEVHPKKFRRENTEER